MLSKIIHTRQRIHMRIRPVNDLVHIVQGQSLWSIDFVANNKRAHGTIHESFANLGWVFLPRFTAFIRVK